MILAAGLLVLLGLGLFVAGILTGVTALYWACVGACVVAAVLLLLVRRRSGTSASAASTTPATPTTAEPSTTPEQPTAEEPAAAAAPAAATEPAAEEASEPGVEEVEVSDLLLVVDLTDEVLVVDEHPRYHLAECTWLAGRQTIPLPLDEARSDGFTPCAVCSPDRTLAERARQRKHTAGT